ncbi:MAG: ABC-F family ATP-binding cassette domain-containing protein [Acidobacteriota bacterium]|nr:MAG: ABC-F family ATP-binding cassette domain-containing protein [Acidobacteriota bacterium]
MLFKVTEAAKSFGGHEILKDVSFQVNPGEKVGLVGRNGAGKTTLFRIIRGEESADTGAVEKLRGLKIGMLDQHVDFEGHDSVHTAALSAFKKLHDIEAEMRRLEASMAEQADEEILSRYADLQTEFERNGGFEYTARAESILLGLGFGKDTWGDDTAHLSGGQKNRLGMVRLLLSDADLLLLDEPTNHLDVGAVEWLEDFLRFSDLAFVVISHDRYFLDRTCTRIIDLENGRAYSYSGNYSSYLQQAELRREQQQREYENQQAVISKTEAFIRKNLAGQKTKQAKSRRNMLERMERIDAPAKEVGGGSFRLDHVERTGTHVLTTEHLSVGFGETVLADDIDLVLLRGERLGIIGGNGTGKTTLLKTLLGKIRPVEGKFTWGAKTRPGYYSQQLEDLEPSNEVIGEFRRVAPLADNGEIRSFLARFLFFGDDVFKRVRDLSGGEKSRLSLAKLVYSGANVLLLDEPTNHLDIPAREALESALLEFPGTIIVVSHDRFFLDRITGRTLDLRGPEGTELFNGNYSEYHDRILAGKIPARDAGGPEAAVEAQLDDPQVSTPKPDLSKNERNKIETRIREIEQLVTRLEEELASVSHKMSLPESASDPAAFAKLTQEFEEREERIDQTYREWEELQERLG